MRRHPPGPFVVLAPDRSGPACVRPVGRAGSPMGMDEDEPAVLAEDQAEREAAEREHAEEATTRAEEFAALRRAEKADYLKARLEDQVQADGGG